MDLSSTRECDSALMDLGQLASLSPEPDANVAAAAEVCSDAASGSGMPDVGDGSGRALCEAAKAAQPKIAKRNFQRWSALSAVPVMMSCSSFKGGGAFRYGRKAYQQVYRVYLRALVGAHVPVANATALGRCSATGAQPDLDFLVYANGRLPLAVDEDLSKMSRSERVAYLDEKFSLRGETTGFRKGNVFQGIPMSSEEVEFLRREWPNGEMSVQEITTPFMSHDVTPPAMVSGRFAYHTPVGQLCAKLGSFQEEASKLDAFKVDPAGYQAKVAQLSRKCIAVHPFGDGNGRACGLWAVHALAKNGLLPSIRWPHPDYSIPLEDYQKRFVQGTENASALAK